jgi:hypothetical protein
MRAAVTAQHPVSKSASAFGPRVFAVELRPRRVMLPLLFVNKPKLERRRSPRGASRASRADRNESLR